MKVIFSQGVCDYKASRAKYPRICRLKIGPPFNSFLPPLTLVCPLTVYSHWVCNMSKFGVGPIGGPSLCPF